MGFIDNIKLYERIINGIQNGNQENFEDSEEEYEESENESNEYPQISHTNLPPPPGFAKELLPTPPVTKPLKSGKPSPANSNQHPPAPPSMKIPAPPNKNIPIPPPPLPG